MDLSWVLKFIHFMALATLAGSQLWVTCVEGITILRKSTRRGAAQLLSILFPRYFTINSTMSLLLCLTYYWIRADFSYIEMIMMLQSRVDEEKAAGLDLLYPSDETKAKLEELKTQSAHYKHLCKRFGSLHGVSMIMNITTLASTCLYVFVLSNSLKM